MTHTIHVERYGKIEIGEESRTIYFYEDDMEYQIREDGMFYDCDSKLWKVELTDDEIILKIIGWVEIGRTKL